MDETPFTIAAGTRRRPRTAQKRSSGGGSTTDNAKLHAFFRTRVYDVRPLPELARQGAIWAGVFLVFGLVVAVPQKAKRSGGTRKGASCAGR